MKTVRNPSNSHRSSEEVQAVWPILGVADEVEGCLRTFARARSLRKNSHLPNSKEQNVVQIHKVWILNFCELFNFKLNLLDAHSKRF